MIKIIQYSVIIDTDLVPDKIESAEKVVDSLQHALFEELTKWEGVLAVTSNTVTELADWRYGAGN